jgi:hypothetical protein
VSEAWGHFRLWQSLRKVPSRAADTTSRHAAPSWRAFCYVPVAAPVRQVSHLVHQVRGDSSVVNQLLNQRQLLRRVLQHHKAVDSAAQGATSSYRGNQSCPVSAYWTQLQQLQSTLCIEVRWSPRKRSPVEVAAVQAVKPAKNAGGVAPLPTCCCRATLNCICSRNASEGPPLSVLVPAAADRSRLDTPCTA